MKITEAELQLRKQRIMDASFALFCRYGIDKVTLSDIAAKAHVGDSTIYRYFGTKPLLVRDTLSVLWRAIGEQLEAAAETTAHFACLTGFEQLAIRLASFRNLYLDNADYILFSYEAKFYLQRNNIQISPDEYDLLMHEIKGPCIATLDKGKADGTIPLREDSEDIFYAIWGAVRGYIVKIVIYEGLCRDHSPWESRFNLLVKGILSAVSHKWELPHSDLEFEALFERKTGMPND